MLRIDDIDYGYDATPVLDGVSLSVNPGEVLAIIGPSGVGKTTLLRILSLSLQPDNGMVTVRGTEAWNGDYAERLSLRRRIGMVFQEASLFDTTVARNVEYGLRVRSRWKERLRRSLASLVKSRDPPASVTEALDLVGLSDQADTAVGELSEGEAQRVSFARAVAFDPDILLLDEPTSDLDPRNTAVIEKAIERASNQNRGVVIATHDMHQAERIGDRVGVLLGESLTEIGPQERVFENPTDERTHQFISGELIY